MTSQYRDPVRHAMHGNGTAAASCTLHDDLARQVWTEGTLVQRELKLKHAATFASRAGVSVRVIEQKKKEKKEEEDYVSQKTVIRCY
ncbi:hypothetical protein DPMN_087822 [Dreissena polymorpha]|uniref:Uncharacterized protein n=1 Tax=Dreissena polymorpha TaxID=45954 RepID=A0A9D4KTD6_DREPO|nr:hypothetical protein DPMN_087822 [Dreissena polymorpha]